MDVARVTAILLVTAYHLWRHFGSPKVSLFYAPIYKIAAMGYVGVDLFFVISGFAMMLTWTGTSGTWSCRAKAFYRARLWRIYPPYIFAMAFWVCLVSVGVNPKGIGQLDLITHLTFTHSLFPSTMFSISGVFWSLAIEVQFYLLFPLLVRLNRMYLLIALALLACLVLHVDETLPMAGPASYVFRWNAITFMPLFLLGTLLYDGRIRGTPDRKGFVLCVMAAMLVIALSEPYSLFLTGRELAGAFLATAFLRYMPNAEHSDRRFSLATLVASASYSIYLYNYIFITSLSPIVPGAFGYLAYFSWVIAFGVFMWWLIEKPLDALRHHFTHRKYSAMEVPGTPDAPELSSGTS